MRRLLIVVVTILMIIGCESNEKIPISKQLDKEDIEFIINNRSDTLIQGKNGTLVYFEGNSFVDEYGEIISGPINIVLKELYAVESMITQNISMISNGQILETGGMINLRAYSNGKELNLKKDKGVVVHFPKKQNSKEMNLFYGKKDSAGIIEWELEESSTYRLVDTINPWYTKYKELDSSHFYLESGELWVTALRRIFNLNDKDREELLNKTVDLHYILFSDGELAYLNQSGSKISRRLKRKLEKTMKNFPKCRPYSREGYDIDMKGFFKIYSKVVPPKYKSNREYLSTIEARLKKEDSSTEGLELAELQYYIFDSRKLGWMNCDKFVDNTSPRVNYIVKVPKSKNVFAKIIFRDYKTVITGDEKEGKFIFNDLPINEPVKIVVIDEKRGKPLLEIIDTVVSKNPIEIKKLTELTLTELKERLKELE